MRRRVLSRRVQVLLRRVLLFGGVYLLQGHAVLLLLPHRVGACVLPRRAVPAPRRLLGSGTSPEPINRIPYHSLYGGSGVAMAVGKDAVT